MHLPGFDPDRAKLFANKNGWEVEMAQDAVNLYERAQPEALKVAVLDRDHLARMTFGDRSLEREVLQLFDRQSELLLERAGCDRDARPHTQRIGCRDRCNAGCQCRRRGRGDCSGKTW